MDIIEVLEAEIKLRQNDFEQINSIFDEDRVALFDKRNLVYYICDREANTVFLADIVATASMLPFIWYSSDRQEFVEKLADCIKNDFIGLAKYEDHVEIIWFQIAGKNLTF